MTSWLKVTLDYRPREAFSLLVNNRNSQVIWKTLWVYLCTSTIFSCEMRAHFPLNIHSSFKISHGPWLWFSLTKEKGQTQSSWHFLTYFLLTQAQCFPWSTSCAEDWVLICSVESAMGPPHYSPQSSLIWDPGSFRDGHSLSKWWRRNCAPCRKLGNHPEDLAFRNSKTSFKQSSYSEVLSEGPDTWSALSEYLLKCTHLIWFDFDWE